MRAKEPPSLSSPAGAMRLMTHAMMGAALGLSFGLMLDLFNPFVAALLEHGGSSAIVVITFVTTFAIGATLTGAVFILAENKDI